MQLSDLLQSGCWFSLSSVWFLCLGFSICLDLLFQQRLHLCLRVIFISFLEILQLSLFEKELNYYCLKRWQFQVFCLQQYNHITEVFSQYNIDHFLQYYKSVAMQKSFLYWLEVSIYCKIENLLVISVTLFSIISSSTKSTV